MVHSVTRWFAVLVAVLAASAPAAVAQDAGEIVRHAAAAMQRVVQATQSDIQGAAARGIAAIDQLDDNGAGDDRLIAAAQHASRVVAAQAHQGTRHVNLIAARALEALRQIRADRRYFALVHAARDAAHDDIGQTARRAHGAIAIALREALND